VKRDVSTELLQNTVALLALLLHGADLSSLVGKQGKEGIDA
jgi:hypothetical protein